MHNYRWCTQPHQLTVLTSIVSFNFFSPKFLVWPDRDLNGGMATPISSDLQTCMLTITPWSVVYKFTD